VSGAQAVRGAPPQAAPPRGALWGAPRAARAPARWWAPGAPFPAGPTPLANGVLVAGVTGDIMLIDATTDSIRWHTRRRAPIEVPPIVKDRELFLVTGNGIVEAYR